MRTFKAHAGVCAIDCRNQRRCRAAAIAGLRSAVDSSARLFVGAGLLGVGRRRWLLLGAGHVGVAA